MKKTFTLFLCLLMFVSVVFISIEKTQAYTTNQRSKAIHVVYDDSVSMFYNESTSDPEYYDRWGQVKYAMEVFAAMLEENDIMNIYFMSDFINNPNESARITISGSENAEQRVRRIHDYIPSSSGTPFDPVIKAYEDLKNLNVDEKWLVILTDGEFNRLNGERIESTEIDVDGYFLRFVNESDVNITLLAMGEDAAEIKENLSRNIYFEHAKNSNGILEKITTICNRIFNRNRLSFTNEAKHEFSFDIPMLELLVFAQGANVQINGINGDDTYNSSETVNVRYSEVASTDSRYNASNPNIIVSRNLTGIVATFRDIPKDSYSLDISGAQTIEIYYKPVVNVDIKLFQNGEEVLTQNIIEGEYQIRYGIVNEDGDFFESSLLGKVEYEATFQNDGQTAPLKSGDTVNLKRGELVVDVSASFLEINTANNTVKHRVLSESTPLNVDIIAPNGNFTVSNLDESGAFIVTIKREGNLLTEAQWQSMPLPVITTNAKVDITEVKRGINISTFEFHIKQRNGDKYATSTGNITLNAIAELVYDEQLCIGEGSTTVNIKNDISFWERVCNWIKKLWYIFIPLLFLLLALLLWWLLWGRKKRFPKYMKTTNKPIILVEKDSNTVQRYGSFKINSTSKWMPFCPETGVLRVAAEGKALPSLSVKAVGNERMEITNISDFSIDRLGGVDFFINDQQLAEGVTRKKEVSCTARFKSVHYSMGTAATHTCSFARKGKKRK